MPSNPRQQTKRKLDQAANALDTCLVHLLDASEKYRPGVFDYKPEGYPEYYEPIDAIATGILMHQELIKELKTKV